MKLILSLLVIIFISINSIKAQWSSDSSQSSGSSSSYLDYTELINYIPYNEDCSNSVTGVGFGIVGTSFNCLQNTTTGSINNFVLEGDTLVNLTSSHWGYCDDPVASQIMKIGTCNYYSYSKTNYNVFRSEQPPIPSNSYLIENFDPTCSNVLSYWFASNNTVITDFKQSLKTTYFCYNNNPFTKVCQNGQCNTVSSDSSPCSQDNPSQIICV